MKKQTKTALIVSAGLIVLGFIISFASAALAGFDLNALSTDSYTRKTAHISESFDSLRVSVSSHDIRLLPAEDGRCRVEYDEGDRSKFTVQVSGGTLTVTNQSIKNWNIHLGFSFNYSEPQVSVYLPESEYRQVQLQTSSGDIICDSGFSFEELSLSTTSGDIQLSGTATELKADTTSGDIHVSSFTAARFSAGSTSGSLRISDVTVTDPGPADGLYLHTTSGNVVLTDVRAENLRVSTTSGDIKLDHVLAAGNAQLGAVSGRIHLTLSDAASFDISTTSGDVEGSLLSPKYFDVSTTSGKIDLPYDHPDGGHFKAKTVSGDVDIRIGDN